MNVVPPLPPIKSKQPGVTNSLLYSGSRFVGHQKSKGNQYDVEVILQVSHRFHAKWANRPVSSFQFSTYTSFLVCQPWRMLFMWVPENKRAHWRISYIDDIFWWRNNLKKVSISNTKMGGRRRSRQKTLGKIEKKKNLHHLVTRILFFSHSHSFIIECIDLFRFLLPYRASLFRSTSTQKISTQTTLTMTV